MKSLKASGDKLSSTKYEIGVLDNLSNNSEKFPRFEERLKNIGMYPLKPVQIEILQVNVGKMCNQVCEHCHVDAGPDRKEIMTKDTMVHCLHALEQCPSIHTVDLTGGAPEMNPEFLWFADEISKMNRKIIVRSNLTILVSNKRYLSYPDFFKKHKVTVIASLPCYTAENTDKQRGSGVFAKSIQALTILNELGYGKDKDLELHLVFNPLGASLPGPQDKLQEEYKKILWDNYHTVFNNLYTITNMPISRFLKFLMVSGKLETYMEVLAKAFNPAAVNGLMCRNTISVGWDGNLYDCDFNQMLELNLAKDAPRHISEFNKQLLEKRNITFGQHCYGCTAGAGSSCQGSIL